MGIHRFEVVTMLPGHDHWTVQGTCRTVRDACDILDLLRDDGEPGTRYGVRESDTIHGQVREYGKGCYLT